MRKKVITMKDMFLKRYKVVFLIVIGIVAILLWPFSYVALGCKLISYNCITGTFNVKDSGIQFVIPFIEEIVIYPVTERIYTISRDADNWAKGIDGSIQVQTKDSQTISVDVSVIYHLDAEKLTEMCTYFNGSDISYIEENYIRLYLSNIMSNIASSYTVDEIYGQKRVEFEEEIYQCLGECMNIYHIIIDNILINNVRVSDIYQELLNARVTSEINLIEANNIGEINTILSETLTDNVLKYEALQELNENVKIIIVPSDIESQLDLEEICIDTLNEE